MAFNFQSQPDTPLNLQGFIPAQLGGYIKWGVVIVAIIALFAIATLARSIYTDWLWFDSLGYLSLEGMLDAAKDQSPEGAGLTPGAPEEMYCTACFTGDYPIPVPDAARPEEAVQ